jgi:hypothetical protein
VRRLLYAAYFLEVGLLLVVLPWTTFWDRNYLFEASRVVQAWAENYYIRGAVSGLGLLNLGIGFAEVAGAVSERLGYTTRRGRSDLARPTHAP